MTEVKQQGMTRRGFTKTLTSTGVGLAAMAQGPFVQKVLGANEQINMAVIGVRGQGRHDSYQLMNCEGVKFVAACDVDQRELEHYLSRVEDEKGQTMKPCHDFREVLDMNDVDAVVIATPDHWHALPFVYACEAGKDIYVEKPIAHNITEGRAMVNAARKFKRVVQVGSQQRSDQVFQDAIDFVRSGKLGDIHLCRAWILGNSSGIGHVSPSNPPEGFDWDMWLGPAPYQLYRANMNHWNWRWFFDFAGGQTADWGVHMMDIICLAMGQWDPIEVSSHGGTFVLDDDRDTPDTQIAVFKFPDFVLHWEVRWGNGRPLDGFSEGHGSEWIGTNGTLGVNRGRWEVFSEGDRLKEKPETVNPVQSNHHQNFVDCIRSRQTPRSDIESMHKTTTLCHLANIAFRTGKKLEWDADQEIITNEPSAMDCPQYRREYRAPWHLPFHKA
ncbi:MAG: Gfo/Idh/MocA family protein [bacterium]|jgi:predicted dehydrogenase